MSDLVGQQKVTVSLRQNSSEASRGSASGAQWFEVQSRACRYLGHQAAAFVQHPEGPGQRRHTHTLAPQQADPARGRFTIRTDGQSERLQVKPDSILQPRFALFQNDAVAEQLSARIRAEEEARATRQPNR
jgi:hypothetical protein